MTATRMLSSWSLKPTPIGYRLRLLRATLSRPSSGDSGRSAPAHTCGADQSGNARFLYRQLLRIWACGRVSPSRSSASGESRRRKRYALTVRERTLDPSVLQP